MATIKSRVLIIEDEKPIAHSLELKLAHEGIGAIIVANGEDCLSLLEKEKFDLILLDLVMPKMDGFKVLEILKGKGIKTPVIVLSNLSQTEDEKRVRALGAIEFFIKSDITIAEIVERAKKKLNL